MGQDQDVERMAVQEQRLRFARFNAESAWLLGQRLRTLAGERGTPVVIEIRIAGRMSFFHAMEGATPANADWARRKCNTVELMHRSSYAIGCAPLKDGMTFEQRMGMPTRDYASAGGGFPVIVEGVGVIGAVAVSGLPQRDDHALVVEALAEMCGVPHDEVRLPARSG
jgi:uncharacterized protein (UPF0303 family)